MDTAAGASVGWMENAIVSKIHTLSNLLAFYTYVLYMRGLKRGILKPFHPLIGSILVRAQ